MITPAEMDSRLPVQHPAENVPSQAIGAKPVRPAGGNWKRAPISCATGSAGAMRGANTATNTQARQMISPRRNIKFFCLNMLKNPMGKPFPQELSGISYLITHPRVNDSVEDIDEQVDNHIGQRDEHRYPANSRKIQCSRRQVSILPDAGPGKNLLHKHHAAKKITKPHARHCDDRDQGVAQGMTCNQTPLTHPLCPSGAYVVHRHRLQQIAAGLAGDQSHRKEAQHHGRQDQMGNCIPHQGKIARKQPVEHVQPRASRRYH